jgi:hypothetical protein
MTPMTLPRKKETFQIDADADKSIFFKNDFPNLSKIRIRIWIGMKMDRRIGIFTSHASPLLPLAISSFKFQCGSQK